VQISVCETLCVENRGGYYDRAGATRDMLQNHLLQLLCLVAMEPPAQFEAEAVRDEKVKILRALKPITGQDVQDKTVRGQYGPGHIGGQEVPAYYFEKDVDNDTDTETFVAVHAHIDNWRWAGVPFFLRTGKRMPRQLTEIAIQFKNPPLNLFSTVECDGDLCDIVETRPNQLVLRIQPQEAISLKLSAKRPGMNYHVQPVSMDFDYGQHFDTVLPEAYERLLLDVIRGDSTLFTRNDELEAAWRFVTPVLKAWESSSSAPELYAAGTWGPAAADRLISEHRANWRAPR